MLLKSLAIVGMSLVLAGCATTKSTVVPTLTPLVLGPTGSAPITFTRLVVRVPSGTELGAHHEGMLQIVKFKHVWQSNLTVASDEFKIIASEHMKSSGYEVLGGDNLLFGIDKSAKAEYQIGGTVTTMELNTFGSLAGNYSDANMTVEWQLYNALRQEVVFADTTVGYAKHSGATNACVQGAFRAALSNLMANPAFVEIVGKRPSAEWGAAIASGPLHSVQRCEVTPRSMPGDLDELMDCVVLIRAGASIGSGVVIASSGEAITAAHVVSGLENVVVVLHSGLELTAEVIKEDLAQDVALIKLPGKGHACMPLLTGQPPAVGEELYAIGAPSGEELAFSVSRGIVSGHRTLDGFSYLQTDASLNPGNSGGPLINSAGQVVAIVSWKIAAPGFEGLSFGVPWDAIQERLSLTWE